MGGYPTKQNQNVISLEIDGVQVTIDHSKIKLTSTQVGALTLAVSALQDAIHTAVKGNNGHRIRNSDIEHQHQQNGPSSPQL